MRIFGATRMYTDFAWLWAALFCFCSRAEIIVQWNFNSPAGDATASTGTLAPSVGSGVVSVIGGPNSSFGSVASGATSDSESSDNSQLRLASFPGQGTGNKSAGVELSFSTVGFENIKFEWDHYNSATASRYWRLQYSTDGIQWNDHEAFANTTASEWHLRNAVSFGGVSAVRDNPNFAIRFVSEFESAGAEGYAAVRAGSSYSTAGTLWLDMLTVSGDRITTLTNDPPIITPPVDTNLPPVINPPANTAPVISAIANQHLVLGQILEPISFSVSDAEGQDLNVSASSSSDSLVDAAGLTVSGLGSGKTLIIVPKPGATGVATITVIVSDGQLSSSVAFEFSIAQPARPVLVQWSFNSAVGDGDPSTGAADPVVGSGSMAFLGAVTHSFGTVGGGATSDTAASDNSMLRLSAFAKQGTENKVRGVEFRTSTRNQRAIALTWDQYNSATASGLWRVQYTTNGVDFLDFAVSRNSTPSKWLTGQIVSFEGVPGVENNQNFGIRLVAEFESTAIGTGANEYVPVDPTSNYSTAGTLWLDMLAVSGDRITTLTNDPPIITPPVDTNPPPVINPPANTAPVISAIASQHLVLGQIPEPISFSVSDAESQDLSVSVSSSNDSLVDASGLIVSALGSGKTLIIVPKPGSTGVATITVTVGDGALSSSVAFEFSITQPARTVLAQWSFNGAVGDGDPSTGVAEPAAGSGSMAFLGAVTHSFGTVGGGATSDAAASDNSTLRLSAFAKQGTENKGRGVEFRTSTRNQRAIALVWDQYNSATGSGLWRVQDTTNGVDFLDYSVVRNGTPSKWLTGQSVSFDGVPGVENNRNFGLRLVAEFESTAIGTGADEYLPVDPTSNYSTAGTLWLDMITIYGEPVEFQNQNPEISLIPTQTIRPWLQPSLTIPFSVSDVETAPENLTLSVSASIVDLFENSQLEGTGADRTLRIMASKAGSALVTVRVTDDSGRSAERSFTVEVLANERPFISAIPDQQGPWNSTIGPLAFTIGDNETSLEQLIVEVSSSNDELVGPAELVLGGTTGERTLSVTPRPDAVGTTAVTVRVSDGALFATATFQLWVFATNQVANSPPAISPLPDQTLSEGSENLPILFQVSDPETGSENLRLSVRFEPAAIVTNYVIAGTTSERTITLFPDFTAAAEVWVTISVEDGEEATAETAFKVMVVPKPAEELPQDMKISVARNDSGIILSWPATADFYVIEGSPGIEGGSWSILIESATKTGNSWTSVVPVSEKARYFRLRKVP